MKKPLAILLAASLLAGCAQVQTAWNLVSGASVSPTTIIVAANAFDAAEVSAAQYLVYCKTNSASAGCTKAIEGNVVAAVRSGRAARNALEPYITGSKAGPSALYNTLIAAVTTLQGTLPSTPGAAK